MLFPDCRPKSLVRRFEMDVVANSAGESLVHVVADDMVAGQKHDTVEVFDFTEQHGDLLVVVAVDRRIMAVFRRPGREQGFTFVEQNDRFFFLCPFEEFMNAFGRFADIAADDVVGTDVDQIQAEFMGNRIGSQGFAAAGRSVEQIALKAAFEAANSNSEITQKLLRGLCEFELGNNMVGFKKKTAPIGLGQ